MNMEENKKKDFWKNVVDFLEKNGFYVALGICIVIIAVAVVSVRNNNVPFDESELNMNLPESENQGDAVYGDIINEYYVMYENLPDVDDLYGTDGVAVPVSGGVGVSAVTSSIEFIMPVTGSITFDYSMDQLTYSRTLGDWRTHSGVDLAADIGTAVKCVADGIVKDIKNDPGFGLTIIVEHEGSLKTVYANLGSADMVQVNQKVKAGDVIGSVGDTALFECAEQSHLHFEVLENGKHVDPKGLLPLN